MEPLNLSWTSSYLISWKLKYLQIGTCIGTITFVNLTPWVKEGKRWNPKTKSLTWRKPVSIRFLVFRRVKLIPCRLLVFMHRSLERAISFQPPFSFFSLLTQMNKCTIKLDCTSRYQCVCKNTAWVHASTIHWCTHKKTKFPLSSSCIFLNESWYLRISNLTGEHRKPTNVSLSTTPCK